MISIWDERGAHQACLESNPLKGAAKLNIGNLVFYLSEIFVFPACSVSNLI